VIPVGGSEQIPRSIFHLWSVLENASDILPILHGEQSCGDVLLIIMARLLQHPNRCNFGSYLLLRSKILICRDQAGGAFDQVTSVGLIGILTAVNPAAASALLSFQSDLGRVPATRARMRNSPAPGFNEPQWPTSSHPHAPAVPEPATTTCLP